MPAGTRGPLCAGSAEKTAQQHTGVANHSAFPAQWFDGLCALSPATSSLLSPSPCELAMARDPVEPRSIFARLDRSNDGQDHTFLPYAAHPASPRGFAGLKAPFVRTEQGPHEVHLALVPPSRARRSRVHRTPIHVRYDVRSPLSEDRDGGIYAVIPNFGKARRMGRAKRNPSRPRSTTKQDGFRKCSTHPTRLD